MHQRVGADSRPRAAAGHPARANLQAGLRHLLEPADRDKIRDLVFPGGRFDVRFVGQDATWIAAQAGIRVPGTTRVLLAPFPLAVPEEPLAHEKLCPVLGVVTVPGDEQGIDAARAVLRIGGQGHSAAIHSTSPATIMAYGAALGVLRVAVNAGSSLGSAGLETGLPPTMTIGTGFFGRSSLGENLQPKHLVQWTRLAYHSDPAEAFGDFAGLDPWQVPAGSVPPYPLASNLAGQSVSRTPVPAAHPATPAQPAAETLRAEIRRVVLEELRALTGGGPGG